MHGLLIAGDRGDTRVSEAGKGESEAYWVAPPDLGVFEVLDRHALRMHYVCTK